MTEAKRRIGLFLTIGILLAIAAAWVVRGRVLAVEAQLGERVKVFVAARQVPAQRPLAEEDLRTVSLPASFVQHGMLSDKSQIIGKVSLAPLEPGELLTKNLLISRAVVPTGYRIVRLSRTPQVLFDDNLMPGDTVDLVATIPDQTSKQAGLVTTVYLRNLPVAEVDAKTNWIGIQVAEADAPGLVHLESTARLMQLLRLSPPKGGVTQ